MGYYTRYTMRYKNMFHNPGFLILESLGALSILVLLSGCLMHFFVQCHRHEQKALSRIEAVLFARSSLAEFCLRKGRIQSPSIPKYHTAYTTKALASNCSQVTLHVIWQQCGEQEHIWLSSAYFLP